jgi:hypothetical protein
MHESGQQPAPRQHSVNQTPPLSATQIKAEIIKDHPAATKSLGGAGYRGR